MKKIDTLSTNPAELPRETSAQLTHAIYDGRERDFFKLTETIRPNEPLFPQGLNYEQQVALGTERYFQSKDKIGLHDPSDLQHVGDLYAAYATADITSYPVLSGDHVLVSQAILNAEDTPAKQRFLERISDGDRFDSANPRDKRHLGIILHTEAKSGSNIPHIGTTADYEVDENGKGWFVINTPRDDPSLPPETPNPDDKYFPNVGGDVPMLTSVTARLKVNGKDEGIAGFIVPMNTYDAPEGVYTRPVGETGTPMAHRRISYYDVRIPAENWLNGQGEGIKDGAYYNNNPKEQDPRRRGERLMRGLYVGRMGLSAGASAMQRLSLHLYNEYAAKREIPGSPHGTLLNQPEVARKMTEHLVETFATTAFSNAVRRHFEHNGPDRLLANLVKPFITDSADRLIPAIAKPTGARGHLNANLFGPMARANSGASTAEGINHLMELTTGYQLRRGAQPPEISGHNQQELPWYGQLLTKREEALRSDESFNERRAIQLAKVTQVRLAYDALLFEQNRATGQAKEILADIANIYAMQEVNKDAAWFLEHGHLTPNGLSERESIRQLREELDARIDRLSPKTSAIIKAFGLPKHIPYVPITDPDYLRAG